MAASRTLRLVLVLLFIGLLLTPWILRRISADREGPSSTASRDEANYGFRFRESAKASGIDFTHVAPVLDPKLNHIMPQVASMGAAVSVVDFDRDGWQDIYFTSSGEGSANRLYRNKADGSFEDVAPKLGIADLNRHETGVSMGAVWGDYDNDGFEDLFVY